MTKLGGAASRSGREGESSAVPSGLFVLGFVTQHGSEVRRTVLGYFQSSLRDCEANEGLRGIVRGEVEGDTG